MEEESYELNPEQKLQLVQWLIRITREAKVIRWFELSGGSDDRTIFRAWVGCVFFELWVFQGAEGRRFELHFQMKRTQPQFYWHRLDHPKLSELEVMINKEIARLAEVTICSKDPRPVLEVLAKGIRFSLRPARIRKTVGVI